MEKPPPTAVAALDDHDESVRIAISALGDMRNATSRSDPRSPPPILASPSPSISSAASPRSPLSPVLRSPTFVGPSSPDSRNSSDNPSAPDFVSRVTHIPLVNSVLHVYEQGKASSRVVKYGAEIMESSVKTISRPVIDRIPAQLDEFACRQLDRGSFGEMWRFMRAIISFCSGRDVEMLESSNFDKYRRPSQVEPASPSSIRMQGSDPPTSESDRGRPKLKTKTLDGSAIEDRDINMVKEEIIASPRMDGERDREVSGWIEANSSFIGPAPPPEDPSSSKSQSEPQNERQVAQRSRWQAMLLEAGGLSAALSDESMRRLRYCLSWLQYATAHIDAQILILRDFTASLQPLSPRSPTASTHSRHSSNGSDQISVAHMRTLTDVRSDIVNTIRQVVDVVSKYAGGALPEPARTRVRGFILKLPQRWANRAGVPSPNATLPGEGGEQKERESVTAAAASGVGVRRQGNRRAAHRERGTGSEGNGNGKSAASSRAPSPSTSPRLLRPASALNLSGAMMEGRNGHVEIAVTATAAAIAAQRILVLATESLDMMRGVTGVVKDSLDRADAWVGRLRTVGIQRGEPEAGANPATDIELAPPGEFDFSSHRRGSLHSLHSLNSQYDEHEMPSPYSGSSTTYSYAGGSVPSTPGGGAYSPVYAGAASPPPGLGLGLSAMSLGSKYSTPRSVIVGLPSEEGDATKERDGDATMTNGYAHGVNGYSHMAHSQERGQDDVVRRKELMLTDDRLASPERMDVDVDDA
ncbi:Opi1-domain-containing protein [Pluteus cervinus]|uniref:Opi1-domain-containing protein n=1 Tax=Pluteus cervinus TaxID=181527 RepID=A0ACD3ALL8_9AGAR|nr:Opi1-domain-containing protein [Pluteus cervinus]